MIPKIIHQIFYPVYMDTIPLEWKENMQQWKAYHPDYTHILWDYDTSLRFLKTYYPWFVDTWLEYKHPIQRCDAFRLFAVYHYGGIYIDLDESPNQSFDNLLQYNVLLPQTTYFVDRVSNFLIGSVPRHPFLQKCITSLEDYKHKYRYFGRHLHVMYSTGPMFITDMVKEYNDEVVVSDIFVLSAQVVHGKHENDTKHPSILLTSKKGKTWNTWDTNLINFFIRWKKEIVIALLCILIVILYYYYNIRQCRMVCASS